MTATADPFLNEHNTSDEERYLLSLLLMSTMRALRDDALTRLSPGEFWDPAHGEIWRAAQHLREADKPINRRTLAAASDARNTGEVLDRLTGYAPRAADFPGVVAEVKRCAKMRGLVEFADRTRHIAAAADDYSQAFGLVVEQLDKLAEQGGTHGAKRFDQLLDEFAQAMLADNRERVVVKTPWPSVNDKMAGGLHTSRSIVIAGRPGDGKSVAGANIAQHASAHGHAAAIFSAEMPDLEVTGRMVADGASIEMDEIARRDLSDRSWQAYAEYTDRATQYPVFVDDNPDINFGYIRTVCRALKRQTDLKVAVVDYLQLLKGEAKLPREQQVANMSRSAKLLSRELDIAVVVLAQLNRKSVDRGRPAISDLRESGAIEQDADAVILLARQYFTEGDMAGKPNGQVTVDIPKNRLGAPCSFDMWLHGRYSRIVE
jgi:replicative DNA helicase